MADINLNINEKELIAAAKALQKAAKDIQNAFKKAGGPIPKDVENLKKYAQAQKKLTVEKKKLTAIEKEELRLKTRLETLTARNTLATSKNAREIIKQEKAYRKLNAQLRSGGKNTASWGKALGSFQFKFNALGNIAANVTSRISMALKRGMRDAIKTIMDFEQAMTDVKAITQASAKDFKALSEGAKRFGRETKFSAVQVAQLQKEYAKLGFTTKEILKAQEATLNLAAATGTELPRAAEVLGITLRQFQLDASETGRVADVMTKAMITSTLDTEKFAESMKMVGPIAQKAGYSLERTTTILAQLSDAGIQGTMGGTALRQIFLEMAKGGKDLGERLNELTKEELGLAEATEEVQKRAAAALLVLVESVPKLEDYEKALDNAGGTSKKVADEQLDTLKNSLELLKSAWKGVTIAVGETEGAMESAQGVALSLADALNKVAEVISDPGWQEWTKQQRQMRGVWGNILPNIGDVANAFKSFKTEDVPGGLESTAKGVRNLGMATDELFKGFDSDFGFKRTWLWSVLLGDTSDLPDEILPEVKKVIKELNTEFNEIMDFGDGDGDDTMTENLLKRNNLIKDEIDIEKQAALDKVAAEEIKQKKIQATFDLANKLTTSFTNIFETAKQKELSAAGDNAEKREEIEKKYHKRQQALAISQALVDGAASILKTKANLGLPLAIPFMVADAAITAAQVGTIVAQKFAKGGIDIDGPSHARGGIAAEIEGGESVINKRSTSKYKGLLDAINQDDQIRIQDALNRDRKILITGGGDPYSKKMYELMKNTHNYGEDTEFYYKQVGNTIYKTRK